MCGRYYVTDDMVKELRKIIKQIDLEISSGRKDVYPSQATVALANRDHTLTAVPMQWGFPHHTGKGLIINARSETALEKPIFRDSLLQRRCVIPAGGFYEWSRLKEKVDFYRAGIPIL